MAIEDTINQAADKLVHAIEVYGPKATELALETGRMSALNEIIQSTSAFLVGGALLFGSYKVIRTAFRKVEVEKVDEDGPWIAAGIIAGFIGVGATIALFVGFFSLLDVWPWVGISHPDIYLAHKMLKL
jgi:hypothetical protein